MCTQKNVFVYIYFCNLKCPTHYVLQSMPIRSAVRHRVLVNLASLFLANVLARYYQQGTRKVPTCFEYLGPCISWLFVFSKNGKKCGM